MQPKDAAYWGIFPYGKFIMIKPHTPPTLLTPESLGESIRLARKNQHLRQEELAGVARVGTRFIVELESGKPTVQLDKLLAVLSALGLTLRLAPKNEQDGIHWAPKTFWEFPNALGQNISISVIRPSRSGHSQINNREEKQHQNDKPSSKPKKTR